MKRFFLLISAAFAMFPLYADEGMWLVQNIDASLYRNMRTAGLRLPSSALFNPESRDDVSDAVVAIGFYGTGSIISDDGLMITNHHVAYSDIFSISTPEENYLEKGFWARSRAEERHIPGTEVFFLEKTLDVSAEVDSLKKALKLEGKPFGMRRLSHLMEKRYSEKSGLEASLASMWSGKKHYMNLYSKYSDVRLVAAPPESIASFGGDTDNWEWPQQKCDFALYRIYAAPDGSPAPYSPDNVPLKGRRKLAISLKGYKEGSFSMVMGFPGRTNRYSSSPEVEYLEKTQFPTSNAMRARRMELLRSWMDKDPEIRLKYSDIFFSLSNLQELQEGEQQCLRRFGVAGIKRATEKELGIDTDGLQKWYSAYSPVERNRTVFRETLVRGCNFSNVLMRARNTKGDLQHQRKVLSAGMGSLDMRVEKELFGLCIEQLYEYADSSMLGPWHKELRSRFKDDYKAMSDWLWTSSIMSSEDISLAYNGKEVLEADPVWKFLRDVTIGDITGEEGWLQEQTDLQRGYRHSIYEKRLAEGRPQYPDANSTMRLTYGKVSELQPWDGISMSYYSTPEGILEKYDPARHEYSFDARYLDLLKSRDWGRWGFGKNASSMHADFITDNDITGGNSGSPVLNAKGELIGLAFDGNKESLAGDCLYVQGYNKCVCVDIRYVLFVLDKYGRMDGIIKELGL